MKQKEDNRTIDALDAAGIRRQRGRPPTGKAMTPAERKAKQRARLRQEKGVAPLSADLSPEARQVLDKYRQFKGYTVGQVLSKLIVSQLGRKR